VAAPTTPPLSGPGTVISFGATGRGAVTALYAHGVIQNPAILSFQNRTPHHPHTVRLTTYRIPASSAARASLPLPTLATLGTALPEGRLVIRRRHWL
jgi:hypothetical protein